MKHLIPLLAIAFSISACGQSVTRQEAEAGAASTFDQFYVCLVEQYQKKEKTEHQDEIANTVISSCAGPLAANVEYEYILATFDPNGKPGHEDHDEFSDRVTQEKVDESRALIKSWMNTSIR